jgi:hypothetical protein
MDGGDPVIMVHGLIENTTYWSLPGVTGMLADTCRALQKKHLKRAAIGLVSFKLVDIIAEALAHTATEAALLAERHGLTERVEASSGRETAAAVLISSGGGSGTFYDLVLLIWGPDGWKHMDTAPLGDRVKVHSVSLAGREILVDLTEQGPDDPMCCPTLRRTKHYLVQDGRLKVH